MGTRHSIQLIFKHRAEEMFRVLDLCEGVDEFEIPEDVGDDGEGDTELEVPAETMEPDQWRRTRQRLLQQELRRLKADLRDLEAHEELRAEAQRALVAIPDQRMAEQLSRAERSLDNQRYRALQGLGRLQQQRRDRAP